MGKIIDRALDQAKHTRRREPDKSKDFELEIKRLRRERDRLIAACAEGRVTPASLASEIEKRDSRIKRLENDLAQSPHRLAYDAGDLEGLRSGLAERMAKFRELMRGRNIPAARQALRKILDGHIKCNPVTMPDGRKRYEIEGTTKLGALLSTASEALVPRKGLEPPQCCHR